MKRFGSFSLVLLLLACFFAVAASSLQAWQAGPQSRIGWGSLTIADLDGDNIYEVIGQEREGTCFCENQLGLAELRAPERAYRDMRIADLDNDGFPDAVANVYSNSAESAVLLFWGTSKGTFVKDEAFELAQYKGFGETIVLADLNNDELVDVFIPQYTQTPGDNLGPVGPFPRNLLFRNIGNRQFEEVGAAAGIATGRSLYPEGAQAIDLDQDGLVDLYSGGSLFRNLGNFQFSDTSEALGLPGTFDEGMMFFDFDNDGDFDFLTHSPTSNSLGGGTKIFVQEDGSFSPLPYDPFPTEHYSSSYGIAVGDVDNDQHDDVLMAGGQSPDSGRRLAPRLYTYHEGRYSNVPLLAEDGNWSDIVALADLNGDGAKDVIARYGSSRIIWNVERPEKFLSVDVRRNGRRNQFGRVVTVQAPEGFTKAFVVDGGSGYMANSQYPVLISNSASDELEVTVDCGDELISFAEEEGRYVVDCGSGVVSRQYFEGLSVGPYPLAPTGVYASASNGEASISWTVPTSGGSPITSFTATATPGGQSCTVEAPSTSCIVRGLANGSPVAFAVYATSAEFIGPLSSPSTQVVPFGTAPDTQINTGPSGTISSNQATFTFAGDPAADTAKIQCRIDSGPFADCTSPKTFTGLTDGSHTATFRAEDAAGNQDQTPATRTFTVDTTAPDTQINTGPSGTISSNQATFTFAGDPAADTAKIQCRIDSGPFADCTSPKTFTGLTDGSHTATFRAEDAAGNQDQTPATRTFTVDTTAPDTQINTGPSGTISSNQATFTFAGDPAADTAKIQCRIDSGPFADCTSPKTFTGLTDGSHTATFRAEDAAGNQDQTPATRTFTVDTTAPDTQINTGPSGTISSNQATFTFAGDPAADTAKIQCRIDSGPFADCTSPKTFTGLTDGSHTATFRAEDAAGNQDQTPATRTFTVDTTAPDTQINTGPSGTISSNQATFTFAGDPAADTAKIQCRIDSGPFADLHIPEDLHRPHRRLPHRHLPGRGRSRKPGSDPGHPHLHSRHHRPRHTDQHRPLRHHLKQPGHIHLRRRPRRRHSQDPVPDRLRSLRRLHIPEDLHRPHRRLPHRHLPGRGRSRKPGSDPGHPHLHSRHHRPRHTDQHRPLRHHLNR